MEAPAYPSDRHQDLHSQRVLVRFKDKHEGMCVSELLSLFKVFGYSHIEVNAEDPHPFMHIRSTHREQPITQAVCQKICERSMLVQGFYEDLGCGTTYDELIASFDLPRLNDLVYAPGVALKMNVETYGVKLEQKYKTDKIHRVLSVFKEKVKVDLKNPTLNLFIFEQMRSKHNVNNYLLKLFFAQEIAINKNTLPLQFQLRDRPFLNTTSMDPCLSFIMANQGLVQKGSLVFDPFVGSGSVLVSCAHFGGYVEGADYDPRVFAGQDEEKESVKENFKFYGFGERFLGVIRADFSQPWFCDRPVLDAIITDPPYGIREGIKKIGRRPDKKKKMVEVDETAPGFIHVPMRMAYQYSDLLYDLCKFAAKNLVLGGRLLFWHAADTKIPVESFDPEKELPSHPQLRLLNVGLQMCGTVNRRLVLYEKIME
jgi:tRNA (guanine10-N2)-methyltransferase